MKKTLILLLFSIFFFTATANEPRIARVADGRFEVAGHDYRFIGANFWYGAILGSPGEGGDRDRLTAELDLLKSLGIDNLRILVGADGPDGEPVKVRPALQTAPGIYNDEIFDGLDFLLSEMGKREMYAILYFNNSWEWSGGFSQYLNWTGHGDIVLPSDGYAEFCEYVGQYAKSEECRQLFEDHLRNVITRTNRYTGLPYVEDPAIFSWQIANEPRPFGKDNKEAFAAWIASAAALIRSLDPNHMISTGSEGYYGCEWDIDYWEQIHADPNIDFLTVHVWPKNWGWLDFDNIEDSMIHLSERTDWYVGMHLEGARRMNKPVVIEEFGFPRDNHSYQLTARTGCRDTYYEKIFGLVLSNQKYEGIIRGCHFWAWGGLGRPAHEQWLPWDDFTGDPAQEPQGLNSVFSSDTTTIEMIRMYNELFGRITDPAGRGEDYP